MPINIYFIQPFMSTSVETDSNTPPVCSTCTYEGFLDSLQFLSLLSNRKSSVPTPRFCLFVRTPAAPQAEREPYDNSPPLPRAIEPAMRGPSAPRQFTESG